MKREEDGWVIERLLEKLENGDVYERSLARLVRSNCDDLENRGKTVTARDTLVVIATAESCADNSARILRQFQRLAASGTVTQRRKTEEDIVMDDIHGGAPDDPAYCST